MTRGFVGFLVALGLGGLGTPGLAGGAPPATPLVTATLGPSPSSAPSDLAGDDLGARSGASAQHERLETDRGPVHVWRPPGYDAASAGVVLYVHGYYTDVDRAFREHRLARQFQDSGRNALFICPEAPVGNHEPVRWTRLEELLATVDRKAKTRVPKGPVAAVAHSGGFRTVLPWLASPRLVSVTLLDGLYGLEAPFLDWLQGSGGNVERRLLLVTTSWTERIQGLLAALPVRVDLPSIPEEGLPPELAERPGLHVYRSQFGHMELVTRGRAIPALAAASGVPGV